MMQSTYFTALIVILIMAIATWLYSVVRKNVNIVDSLWPLMFLAVSAYFVIRLAVEQGYGELPLRSMAILALVTVWALRLCIHLLVRNNGEPEDQRYQDIRTNNQPGFAFKSLYIIFGLQGLLAWIISVVLWVNLSQGAVLSFCALDYLALLLWGLGFAFEAVADWQLHQFKRSADNQGKVLDRGLWRYSRHPNYFGECCIWWAYYLFALSVGGAWTIYAPLLMTVLLLKVSGVRLMESTIVSRKPAYQEYITKTSAFFPHLPRKNEIYSK